MTPVSRILEVLGVIMGMLAWGSLVVLILVAVGACAGCGSTATVKPALVTACGVARVACGVVETACDVVDGATSGAEVEPAE